MNKNKLPFEAWLAKNEIEVRAMYREMRLENDYSTDQDTPSFEGYARELHDTGVL